MAGLKTAKSVSMRNQEPAERKKNFEEVALGYSEEEALTESKRCVHFAPKLLDDGRTILCCPERPCTKGCPVGVDIPDFIKAVRDGEMQKAVDILKAKNSLPGVCGRVCPQESQCQAECVVKDAGDPVEIGRLERYVADWELGQRKKSPLKDLKITPTGKKVAVVGSGPAGLTVAGDLAKNGHKVVMYEALHVAGGVLMYGIPEFRLPKDVVMSEVEYVRSLGVEIKLDHVVGKIITADELLESGYDAVFLGPGAGAPMFLNIEGENLNGIFSANEFLTRVNLMKSYLFPDYDTPVQKSRVVAVIGAGNVAMDATRCALRIGAEQVHIIYRRSMEEVPARHEEVEHALEEGVVFNILTNPIKFIGDEKGNVTEMICQKMELGEPDQSGRRRPFPIKDSEFSIKIDAAIIALGTYPNPVIPETTSELELTRWGTIKTDENTGRTSRKGIWCGGDMATGAATVISAMGAGKRAAKDMDEYLKNN